jgi:hypothetical protein
MRFCALRGSARPRVWGNDVSPEPLPSASTPNHLVDMRHRELERSVWCGVSLASTLSTPMIALVRGHVHDAALGLRVRGGFATGSPGSTWPSSRVFRSLGMRCAALGIGTYDPRLAVEAYFSGPRDSTWNCQEETPVGETSHTTNDAPIASLCPPV